MFNDEIAACKVNVCGCTVSIKYGKSSKLNHNIYRMHMYILLTGYSQGPVRIEGFFAWAADTFYWQVQWWRKCLCPCLYKSPITVALWGLWGPCQTAWYQDRIGWNSHWSLKGDKINTVYCSSGWQGVPGRRDSAWWRRWWTAYAVQDSR